MDAVLHAICQEGLAKSLDHGGSFGKSLVAQHLGAAEEAVKVLLQTKNPPVVESETFPHRIAILHGGVEGAHAGLVAVEDLTVEEDFEVLVSWIVCLEHGRIVVRQYFLDIDDVSALVADCFGFINVDPTYRVILAPGIAHGNFVGGFIVADDHADVEVGLGL